MQGIGEVLGEHCYYDPDSGQFLSGSFMDYYMPRADVLPKLTLLDRPVPSPANPLGAKGAGELEPLARCRALPMRCMTRWLRSAYGI